MAEIWIWNAMASRRRSASDTFIENGLAVLKAGVEKNGHTVRVLDWARNDFYQQLAPAILARPIRALTVRLMAARRRGFLFKAGAALAFGLQQLLARTQKRRMASALRALARDAAANRLRIFGVKVWYGEAFTWAKFLAGEIRRLSPETVLVAGGYHATLYEEDLLENSPFDLAVISEGETPLTRILEAVDDTDPAAGRQGILDRIAAKAGNGAVANLLWREGGRIRKTAKGFCDINARSMPDYGDTRGKALLHVLLESSGCAWGKCRFCVHQHLEPEYRKRDVERIVQEIRTLCRQGIGLFRFAGSDTPPDFGSAIAQGILDAGLRIEFAMGSRARPDAKNPEVFEDLVGRYALLIRAGLRAIFMGGETGHDAINDQVMNKGLVREDLIWTMRALRESEKRTGQKVDIGLAMIYPTPLIEGVTDEDVLAANIELVDAARPDSVMVSPPGPFKNSEWYRRRDEFGFELDEGVIPKMMEYEYVLYKPPELWPKLGIRHRGRDFAELLRLCGKMRAAIEKLGVQTDLSDEHFLMLRACGLQGPEGAEAFKRVTLADIVSCDYRRLAEYCERTNDYSRKLAAQAEHSSASQ